MESTRSTDCDARGCRRAGFPKDLFDGFVQLREREYDHRLRQFDGRAHALASRRIVIDIFT